MDNKPLDLSKKSGSSCSKSHSLSPEKQTSEEEKQIPTMDDEPLNITKKSTHSPAACHSRSAEKQKCFKEEKKIITSDSVYTREENRLKSIEKSRKITEKSGVTTANNKHKYNEKLTRLSEDENPDNLVRMKRERRCEPDLEGKRSKPETTPCINIINRMRIPYDANRNSKGTQDFSLPRPSTSTVETFTNDSTSVQRSLIDNKKEFRFICEFCNKGFNTSTDHQRHVRNHSVEKPHQCEYCDKSFSDPSRLTIHRRIHTDEKPFKCMHCDSCFTQSSDLKRHIRTHTGEKPYACGFCGKRFSRLSNMRVHEETCKSKSKEI